MNITNFVTKVSFELMEAQASISANPNIKWAKFIFTDDKPNGNNQRIPIEEFPNILRTGIFMPIKMASGKIEDGHKNAEPLGVISNLVQSENKVEGLAAFWTAEREDDVNLLKTMTEDNNNPQLSWEVWYDDSVIDDNGIENLRGVVVRASTIVGNPAYKGRTPILAMSSMDIGIKSNEEETMNLEERIKELELMLEQMRTMHDEEMAKMKDELHKAKCDLELAQSSKVEIENELSTLRDFKSTIDRIEAEASKLAEIKAKFVEAGISKNDEYFSANKEKLLTLNDESLSFLLQELVAFSNLSVASIKNETIEVPNLQGEKPLDYSDIKELGRLLRQSAKRG